VIEIRPAREIDLPLLQMKLAERAAEGYEQLDLRRSIVHIAEAEGIESGFVSARLTWQIEPLTLFKDFERNAPPAALRRATYMLARAAEGWIADRARNSTGLHSFFAVIENRNKRMQELAEHIGWAPVYRKCRFFGKDT
jgi:hypothetical protein